MSRKERSFSTVWHMRMDTQRTSVMTSAGRHTFTRRHPREQSCFILTFKTYHTVQTKVSIYHMSKGLKQNHQKIEEVSVSDTWTFLMKEFNQKETRRHRRQHQDTNRKQEIQMTNGHMENNFPDKKKQINNLFIHQVSKKVGDLQWR